MEDVKTSKLPDPTSSTSPWALQQLPESCPPEMLPPAQGPQGLQPSPSYKPLSLQSCDPSFSKIGPRKMLLPTQSC